MDLSYYLSLARRWAWLLILGLVLGVAGGYGYAKLQTPIYEASTRVIVSRASMQAASGGTVASGAEIYYVNEQVLMQTFIELLKSSSIFEKASEKLGYPVSSGQVVAAQVGETRILGISVEDPDPQHAADIANAVVESLILQNEDIEASRYKASDESLQTQITLVEEQIATYQKSLDNQSSISLNEQLAQVEAQMEPLQTEVTQLKKDIAVLTPASSSQQKSKIAELQARLDQISPLLSLYQNIYTSLVVVGTSGDTQGGNSDTARLQSTLVLYQQIYLNLINTREAIRLSRLQNSQSINQIQVAVVPTSPIRPQPMTSALTAGLLGLMLAGGIVFLFEYLDDTMKSPDDVDLILGIPLIGHVADMELVDKAASFVYVAKHPRSPVSEAFRSLRTNLEFAGIDKPLRIILVTGAEEGDGKTTVAVNLAAIFAQGGKRVILVDCDLRRPKVHRFFGIENRVGMTDLFRDNLDVDAVMQRCTPSNSSSKVISVITSGSLPPNPAELLGSQKMDRILAEFASRADVIVIDSPPSIVSDAQVLAAKVDGVLLVLQPGKTHTGAAQVTREQLDRAGANIVGAVFNRIPRQNGYYYGGYRYYSPYYSNNEIYLGGEESSEDEQQPAVKIKKTTRQSLFGNLFKKKSPPVRKFESRQITTVDEKIVPEILTLNLSKEDKLVVEQEILTESMPDKAKAGSTQKLKSKQVAAIEQEILSEPLAGKVKTKGGRKLKSKLAAEVGQQAPSESLSAESVEQEDPEAAKQEIRSESLPRALQELENEKIVEPQISSEDLSADLLDMKDELIVEQVVLSESVLDSSMNLKDESIIEQEIPSQPLSNDLADLVDEAVIEHEALPESLMKKLLNPEGWQVTEVDQNDTSALSGELEKENGQEQALVAPSRSFLDRLLKNDRLQKLVWRSNGSRETHVEQEQIQPESVADEELKYIAETAPALLSNPTFELDEALTPDAVQEQDLASPSASVETPTVPTSTHLNAGFPVNEPSNHQLDGVIGSDYKFVIHKVLEGESLELFAQRFNTTVDAILTVNVNLKNPVLANTMLVIPVEFTDVSKLHSFVVYEVQETDETFEALAKKLQANPFYLRYYNKLDTDEQLTTGSWLLIPRVRAVS